MIHLRDSKLYTADEFAKDMGEMLDERWAVKNGQKWAKFDRIFKKK